MPANSPFPEVNQPKVNHHTVQPLFDLAADTFFDESGNCLFCGGDIDSHFLWIEANDRNRPYIRSLNVPVGEDTYSTCWVNPADIGGFTAAVESGDNESVIGIPTKGEG